MENIILPVVIILPFVILCTPYLVALNSKKHLRKELHVGVIVTFFCLLVGLYITYQNYKGASSMGGIYFLVWPIWAAIGGVPIFLISWLTAKVVFKGK